MRTVKEVSRLTGVSVRTLHHYDSIGLLKPTKVTAAGYRMYDDAAIQRLQTILIFRELQFPLKEIKTILDSPGFDPAEALAQQIEMLEMQFRHIQNLIAYAREIQKKGIDVMNFQIFDKTEWNQYKEEAREKWGKTMTYQEFSEKTKDKSEEDFHKSSEKMMQIFKEIGSVKTLSPAEKKVQEKIRELQQFITENYYTCTDEILVQLSEMYVSDERMKKNIDHAGGEGTAEFVKQAVKICCKGDHQQP